MIVNAGWDGMSAIIETMAAFIFLGERLDDPWKYFGILLIIMGLFFLKLPRTRRNAFKFPKLF